MTEKTEAAWVAQEADMSFIGSYWMAENGSRDVVFPVVAGSADDLSPLLEGRPHVVVSPKESFARDRFGKLCGAFEYALEFNLLTRLAERARFMVVLIEVENFMSGRRAAVVADASGLGAGGAVALDQDELAADLRHRLKAHEVEVLVDSGNLASSAWSVCVSQAMAAWLARYTTEVRPHIVHIVVNRDAASSVLGDMIDAVRGFAFQD